MSLKRHTKWAFGVNNRSSSFQNVCLNQLRTRKVCETQNCDGIVHKGKHSTLCNDDGMTHFF